ILPLVDSVKVLAQEKGIEFKVFYSSARVRTDTKLLRRVLQNLLSNAVRYTDKGKVLMGVRRRGDCIEIQILDTGRGIPVEQQHEIFNEFHQLEHNEQNPGLGLGLAIVERMCRLLNVPLSLRSKVGRGTCFSVRVPLCGWQRPVPQSVARTALDQQPLLLKGKCVLVVDNDQAVREALSSLVQSWGAHVFACQTLEQALALAEQPQLMLVDYHLDDGKVGVEVIAALREKWQFHIPAIVNTADPNEAVREHVVSAEALFLPKPVKQAALKRLIKRVGV